MSTRLDPCLWLAAGVLATLSGTSDAAAETGVVVESVPRGGAGESSGLQPGDVLLTWTRAAAPPANPQPAAGEFDSYFDVVEVLVEQAPRGPVEVQGQRGGQPLTATLSEIEPWFFARPWIPTELLPDYEAGREWVGQGHIDEGLAIWRRKLLAPEGGLDPESAASILFAAGERLSVEQAPIAPARRLREEALQQARRGARPHVLAMSLQAVSASVGVGSQARSLDLAQEAVSVREAQAPDSLALAAAIINLTTPLNMTGQADRPLRSRKPDLRSHTVRADAHSFGAWRTGGV
jgi:hypothetical protein